MSFTARRKLGHSVYFNLNRRPTCFGAPGNCLCRKKVLFEMEFIKHCVEAFWSNYVRAMKRGKRVLRELLSYGSRF